MKPKKKTATATVNRAKVLPRPLNVSSATIDEGLQAAFAHAIGKAVSFDDAVQRLAHEIETQTGGVQSLFMSRTTGTGSLGDERSSVLGMLPQGSDAIIKQLADEVGESGRLRSKVISGDQLWNVVAAPVVHRDARPDVVLSLANASLAKVERLAAIAQTAASHLTMWELLKENQTERQRTEQIAAVADLASQLADAANVAEACQIIAAELKRYLHADQVVVGVCATAVANCDWISDADVSHVNRHGDAGAKVESAFAECIDRNDVVSFRRFRDTDDDEAVRDRFAFVSPTDESRNLPGHDSFASLGDHAQVFSVSLRNEQREPIAAVLVGQRITLSDDTKVVSFLSILPDLLGKSISAANRRSQGWFGLRRSPKSGRSALIKAGLAGAGAVLVAAIMAIPVPYRVTCDCVLEPSLRRYVAAPYEGRLERSAVRPGDLVDAGQTLAEMDRRELEWELAGLQADYRSEMKQRDAASARDEVAQAQHSDLEMRRLALKTELIEHRLENLEIKSPIKGVVLSGDLSRSEGAPLSVGQALYEIAPLRRMIVEASIPESDIQFVEIGMSVKFRLNSDPGTIHQGNLLRVHPRSEIRDQEAIFIAELEIDNVQETLRPGMRGSATIETQPHPLVWNFAHKTWDSIAMKLGI